MCHARARTTVASRPAGPCCDAAHRRSISSGRSTAAGGCVTSWRSAATRSTQAGPAPDASDLRALYPRRRTTAQGAQDLPLPAQGPAHRTPNQAWASDISYIPMAKGSYLVAIMDWYSRRVLSWRVSNTLDADFCIALEEALQRFEAPEIFNTDQGLFTCEAFTDVLKGHAIAIMDGKGRWVDNVFVERLWRSVKYEDVYLRAYETPTELRAGLARYRLLQHQAPSQRTGPTHPGCGVLRSGSPRFGSLIPEEDFTYHTVQFSGSISHAIPGIAGRSGVPIQACSDREKAAPPSDRTRTTAEAEPDGRGSFRIMRPPNDRMSCADSLLVANAGSTPTTRHPEESSCRARCRR